ncbi:hypothetical protein H113_08462 [Trichophyton rubrum MR1459]|nr:hypothetical protein H113_08462 [Trichophyton rubrum MR1459]EZG11998.1 hypothetical protein H107_08546 [Trichophyton rubrum CBS 202.88]
MAWQSRSDPRRQFYWLPQLGSSTTVVFLHAFEQLKIAQNFTVRKHPEYLGFNWLFVCLHMALISASTLRHAIERHFVALFYLSICQQTQSPPPYIYQHITNSEKETPESSLALVSCIAFGQNSLFPITGRLARLSLFISSVLTSRIYTPKGLEPKSKGSNHTREGSEQGFLEAKYEQHMYAVNIEAEVATDEKHNSKVDCKPLLSPKGHGRRQDFPRRDNLGHAYEKQHAQVTAQCIKHTAVLDPWLQEDRGSTQDSQRHNQINTFFIFLML